MPEEFVLTRDIIHDHNERMLNIRKYYPYFKLVETTFTMYKDGRYNQLDMGYIMMAVLRFFIEENNFKEKDVTYGEFKEFVSELLHRDFELQETEDEENDLISYIFDKLKNDGKPFVYTYFDPAVRQKRTVRMKLIEDKLLEDSVVYTITSDAIEFYLDTKEIKDESTITTSQLLLGKLIASKNFKGGTEVVKRINNEVSRLISRKNEVLNLLTVDVFEGVKAFEEFQNTGIRWFEEEQKLFIKNRDLIEKTLRQGEREGKYNDAMEDIYVLESQLNHAMSRHSELLAACTELQIKADDIVNEAKLSRLRTSFDFKNELNRIMEKDRADMLTYLITPLFRIRPDRKWSLKTMDDMLNCRIDREEKGEAVNEANEEAAYVYPDEVEENRIANNYNIFLEQICILLIENVKFDLRALIAELDVKTHSKVENNPDFYSFMVHLCQKNKYSMKEIVEKPDTFLEENIRTFVEEHNEYVDLSFTIECFGEKDMFNPAGEYSISNVTFRLEE